MATRAVATSRATDEKQDYKEQEHHKGYDPEHLHPEWCAGVVAVEIGGSGRLGHFTGGAQMMRAFVR